MREVISKKMISIPTISPIKFVFIATFAPLFLLYFATSPATVYWQDSGIYLSGVKTLGVIYPPGYPLYVFFGYLWTGILGIIFSDTISFAKSLHSFSGLFGGLGSAIVSVTVYKMVDYFDHQAHKSNKKHTHIPTNIKMLISITTGLANGLSYSLWSQSINSEVYSMASFFASLLFLISFLLISQDSTQKPKKKSAHRVSSANEISIFIQKMKSVFLKKRSDQQTDENKIFTNKLLLYSYFAILGLSFANHPLSALIIPPTIYLLYTIRKTAGPFNIKLLANLLFILSASTIIPYLYLPLRSSSDTVLVWNKIDSVKSFIDHLTGAEYFSQETSLTIFDTNKFVSFFELFLHELLVAGIVLFALGIKNVYRSDRKIKSFANFGILFSAIIYITVLFYERGTEYNFWLIPSYNFVYIIVGVGFYALATKYRKMILFSGVISIIFPLLIYNLPFNNKSAYTLPQEFGINILKNLPPNSILITVGDQDSAITKYLQLVENYRKDIVLLRPDDFQQYWRLELIQESYPELFIPDETNFRSTPISENNTLALIHSFLEMNIERKNIYLIQRNLLDIPINMQFVPAGTLWRVSPEDDPAINLSYWDYKFDNPSRYELPEKNEASRRIYNEFGNFVGLKRQKYSEEAKNFELQARKNLADHFIGAYQDGQTVIVINNEGKAEYYKDEILLLRAIEAYGSMAEIDSSFFRADVWLNKAFALEKLGKIEESRKLINEVSFRENTF